ncbi:DUF805 domain-containing protein [Novosphingobium sp. BW1]|uniref:DUF805 domain-containing protein n=1 Tax=Novosphingobium sp. BW1 TaxID=2592621 RepID=UPI001F07E5DB|nr:DUF805 domain-containing protein [Novosphingobium sp. BW1]
MAMARGCCVQCPSGVWGAVGYPAISAMRDGEMLGAGTFALMLLGNMGALATLLIFLVLPGTASPNRFGDVPER